jgi:N4-(beta-N-acetylglucosaminyl)-L-asparaginase
MAITLQRHRSPTRITMPLTRRDFVTRTAAAASLSLTEQLHAMTLAVPVRAMPAGTARVVSSANGLRGVARAWEMLGRGEDTLDAIIAGVNIQELDPDDDSVGLGGLPNEAGVVQLDASCMHGPTRRAGSVASIEDIATPSLVAKAIMDYTDHIMLAGADARNFAIEMGFTPQNLLTERSRQNWLRWRARRNPGDFRLDYDDDVAIRFTHGTINMNAVNTAGDMSSVTTTSGMAYKVPGRVGDSPIIGAGQYCDQTVGAAGSTGRGEANIKACGAFLTVEYMRQGMAPEQACLKTLERVVAMTETRLLNDKGRPRFGLDFYALAKDGRYGSASLYEGATFAVADEKGARVEQSAFLFKKSEMPTGPIPVQRARGR